MSSLEQAEEWFSKEFYRNLCDITVYESFIVINAGSSPDADGGLDYYERDDFFYLLDDDDWDVAFIIINIVTVMWKFDSIYGDPSAITTRTFFC